MADAQNLNNAEALTQLNWHTRAPSRGPLVILKEKRVAGGSTLCEEMMGRTNFVLLLLL